MSDEFKTRAGIDVVNLASVPVDTCSEDPTAVAIPAGQDSQQIIDSIYRDHYKHPNAPVTKAQVNDQTGEIILIRELPDRPEYANEDVFIMKGNASRQYLKMDGGWFPTLTKNEVVALRREQLAKLLQREAARHSTSNITWSRLTFCEEGMSHEACWEMAGNKPWADDFNEDDLPHWAQIFYKIGGAPFSVIGCNSTVQLPDWYLYPDAQDGIGADGEISPQYESNPCNDGSPWIKCQEYKESRGIPPNFRAGQLVTVGCTDSQYQSIQKAIDAAPDSAVIEICDGTYNECLDIKGKSLILKSQNSTPKTTTIVCDKYDDPIKGVFTSSENKNLMISSMTINGHEGGILIENDEHTTGKTDVIVDHCIILNDFGLGANIRMDVGGGQANLTIRDTTITAKDEAIALGNNPAVSFHNNTGNNNDNTVTLENLSLNPHVGYIEIHHAANAILSAVSVIGASSPGIIVGNVTQVSMTDINVKENEGAGIWIYNKDSGSAILNRVTAFNNGLGTFSSGGGLMIDHGDISLIDSTITNNKGDINTGGLLFDFHSTAVFHSINSNWGIGNQSNTPHDIGFSDFPKIYDFGNNATFDCDGSTGICK